MASVQSLGKLIKFIRRPEWEDEFAEILGQHLGPACSNHDVDPDDLFDILGEVASTILHGCALEDYMSRVDEDGHNIVDEYLKRRGFAESAGAKRYMQSFRNTIMSLYEVSDIVSGKSFLARDLLRDGEPVRVMEVSGTKSLKPWDRIGARLIRQGAEWRMGGGVLLYNRRASEYLVETLKDVDTKLPKDLRDYAKRKIGAAGVAAIERDLAETPPLAIMAPTFTGIWLADLLERTLHPQLPELLNTDGHAIIMSTSTFPLLPGVKTAACYKALTSVAALTEAGNKAFNWVSSKGAEPGQASRDNGKRTVTLSATSSTGETLVGSIEIKRDTVVLCTNSRERATAGEEMIGNALAGLADEPIREEMTAAEMLAERSPGPKSGRSSRVSPEVSRPLIHAHLDRHYGKILDEPLPVLGHVSPREAARSDAGRSKVVDWLKDMENHVARSGDGDDPMAYYDFGWIWRELGVAEKRV